MKVKLDRKPRYTLADTTIKIIPRGFNCLGFNTNTSTSASGAGMSLRFMLLFAQSWYKAFC